MKQAHVHTLMFTQDPNICSSNVTHKQLDIIRQKGCEKKGQTAGWQKLCYQLRLWQHKYKFYLENHIFVLTETVSLKGTCTILGSSIDPL